MTSTAGAAGTAPAPAPPAAADQAVAMITTRLVMAGLGWVGTILVAAVFAAGIVWPKTPKQVKRSWLLPLPPWLHLQQ